MTLAIDIFPTTHKVRKKNWVCVLEKVFPKLS